jgi:sugar diacid utilization regulator
MPVDEEQNGLLPTAALRAEATTLRQLYAVLGPDLIEIVTAPRGVDTPIAGVSLKGPLDRIARDEAADCLLLAVGATPDNGTLEQLIASAAAADAAGIVGHLAANPSRQLLETAEEAGVALLSTSEDIAWGELYELIRAAVVVDNLNGESEPTVTADVGLDDLFAIAETTAAVAGGPVTIEDMQSRVLAFSGGGKLDRGRTATILNRRVPEDWLREMRERGMIEHLLASDEVLHVSFSTDESSQPRRAIAIRHDERVLGSIWLAGDDNDLSPDADEALRRAAPMAALQLLRQRAAGDVERRMRESTLATLLAGGDATQAEIQQIDLPADESLVVIALDVTGGGATSPRAIGPRLVDLLTMQLHAYDRSAVATSLEGRVYAVTSSRGTQDRSFLRDIAKQCRAYAARALTVDLRAGISHEVKAPAELRLARQSADECLTLAPESEQDVLFEDVHGKALLASVEQLVSGWYGGESRALLALTEDDEAHRTDYVRTLTSVLENFGNAQRVAKELHIHENTVRYRMQRITEITGVDLADGDARLALELELRARRPHADQ